eukprot:5399667-Prymnesium_polylepis.2
MGGVTEKTRHFWNLRQQTSPPHDMKRSWWRCSECLCTRAGCENAARVRPPRPSPAAGDRLAAHARLRGAREGRARFGSRRAHVQPGAREVAAVL